MPRNDFSCPISELQHFGQPVNCPIFTYLFLLDYLTSMDLWRHDDMSDSLQQIVWQFRCRIERSVQ